MTRNEKKLFSFLFIFFFFSKKLRSPDGRLTFAIRSLFLSFSLASADRVCLYLSRYHLCLLGQGRCAVLPPPLFSCSNRLPTDEFAPPSQAVVCAFRVAFLGRGVEPVVGSRPSKATPFGRSSPDVRFFAKLRVIELPGFAFVPRVPGDARGVWTRASCDFDRLQPLESPRERRRIRAPSAGSTSIFLDD